MIRVLLADDEVMIRAGVRAILTTDENIEVVAEANDGREAVDLALAHRPDVALLDIRMPYLDGLAAAAQIIGAAPAVAVAILTTFGEDGYLARAIDDGARGFLLKSGNPRELLAGIHAIAEGGAYLSPSLAARVITKLRADGLSRRALQRTDRQPAPPRGRHRQGPRQRHPDPAEPGQPGAGRHPGPRSGPPRGLMVIEVVSPHLAPRRALSRMQIQEQTVCEAWR
jgi:DNA-binding NarL/FixJ family response regulator